MKEKLNYYNEKFGHSTAEEVLNYFLPEYGDRIALSSSLGAEDQVLTKMIVDLRKETRIFTLDTGRLFPETYDLIDRTNSRYGIRIDVFFPDFREVEKLVKDKGINSFYYSIENRKECCHIRKLSPLARALKGVEVWITGLRREQAVTRKDLQMVEWDDKYKVLKLNPLINWNEQDVWDYIKRHNIPYNPLHDQGYPSIGCQPCTRAVPEGEDIRSGRWWWENPETKECGLHVKDH